MKKATKISILKSANVVPPILWCPWAIAPLSPLDNPPLSKRVLFADKSSNTDKILLEQVVVGDLLQNIYLFWKDYVLMVTLRET